MAFISDFDAVALKDPHRLVCSQYDVWLLKSQVLYTFCVSKTQFQIVVMTTIL